MGFDTFCDIKACTRHHCENCNGIFSNEFFFGRENVCHSQKELHKERHPGLCKRMMLRRLAPAGIRSYIRSVRPSRYAAYRHTLPGIRSFASPAPAPNDDLLAKKERKAPESQEQKKKKKSKLLAESLPVDFGDISRANVAIRGGIRRTDCEKSHYLSELIGANIYLKPEFRQFTGSFKERGARNAILQLLRDEGSALKGVIAASAGNVSIASQKFSF